jgi:D-beta-D-heptose 7-phosphate kinase/D-beta-D-heptose 1-phosphate adenosyltransferase
MKCDDNLEIIISDYNKGFLTKDIIDEIKQYNIKMIVDPKNELFKYHDCYLIKPNINEVKKYLKISETHIDENLHNKLYELNNNEISVITHGKNGITAQAGNKFLFRKVSQKLNIDVVDTTGCGDIVLSIIGYLVLSEISLENIIDFACWSATQSIKEIGCQTIKLENIVKYGSKMKNKIIFKEDLKFLKNVEKLVFTNGCFDIFHQGHLNLLSFAKQQGDFLVVGLNSDDSIKRLKGEKRPINLLEIRLKLLQALDMIDFIIVFDEDTPYSILQELAPYTLVKGSDYTISEIIGHEFAKNVVLFTLDPSISTTKIINKILT